MKNEYRVYVFKDIITGQEKHVGDEAARFLLTAHQYIDGEKRFKFLRSYTPKVLEIKKATRRKGTERVTFDVIKKIEETEITQDKPPLKSKSGYHRRTTELELNAHGGISGIVDRD